MNIYALVAHGATEPEFVTDPQGQVVYREQAQSPAKDPRGFWTEAVRTDDSTVHQPNSPGAVRGAEPAFSIEGGRVYATFPLTK
jgi:hypothetical protein